MKKALIAGASGLVGNELLPILLEGKEYEKVYTLVRRPIDVKHPKLEEVVCDFDRLDDVQQYFEVEDVFVCLGTTIKKAKVKDAMYKVDVEYPVAIAKLAKEKGAQHYLVISSMNANPNSSIWYSKMKGELEEELKRVSLPTLSIFRPSLLLGEREEFRFGENIAAKLYKPFAFFLPSSWKSRMAIHAKTVALAMYKIAQADKNGITIYLSDEIDETARR